LPLAAALRHFRILPVDAGLNAEQTLLLATFIERGLERRFFWNADDADDADFSAAFGSHLNSLISLSRIGLAISTIARSNAFYKNLQENNSPGNVTYEYYSE
jgi:hypothetical protein